MLASNWFAATLYVIFITPSLQLNLYDTKQDKYEVGFNLQKDNLAFLHIQKTSGTFWIQQIRKNLMVRTEDGVYKNVCSYDSYRKREDCFVAGPLTTRVRGIFWDVNELYGCDIHADYTELHQCMKRDPRLRGQIHTITMLRNPEERYISEFEHVKRGATWSRAVRMCNAEPVYTKTCYHGHRDWTHATWEEFLNCEYNLANNRQVRMLANYRDMGCDVLSCWLQTSDCSLDIKKRNEERMLESAKKSLMSLSFFGLAEYQELSQYLFEKTFMNTFKFSEALAGVNEKIGSKLFEKEFDIYRDKIREKNNLDIELYEFAAKIFFDRVKYFKDKDATSFSIYY